MRAWSRSAIAAATAGFVALSTVSPAAATGGTPGSAGIGDAYYPLAGNGGYEVSHYDIRVDYDPKTDRLTGVTTLRARTTQALSQFNLDFRLHVDSVLVNNTAARFKSAEGELVVTPTADLPKNSDLTIVVRYADVPSEAKDENGYTPWVRKPDGAIAVALDIPRWLYPSNDHPTDKALFDFSVAVPAGVPMVAGGELVSRVPEANGKVRWNWRSSKQTNTYQTFMVVGDYEVRHATTPSGQPLITAYGKDLGTNGPAAKASIERTPEIVEYLASLVGPYPFDSQGGVAVTGIEFALENQTRPVYGDFFFAEGANTFVVAHENMHQWFGDSVSFDQWQHAWLNEGPATYAEWLWSEHLGEGTTQQLAEATYQKYPANDPFWQIPPGDPGVENNFHDVIYERGAMTLQALRTTIGDKTFFTLLRTWVAQHKYSDANTSEFIALAEKLSGKQLDDLFKTWLFTKAKPTTSPSHTTITATPASWNRIQKNHQLIVTNRERHHHHTEQRSR
nr:M1 family metallopeptidase [Kibdelosporangium sp. MJ126-NF4]CEL23078.1 metallopeptidase [Kibdelosporangium sp. MJ126-NF4]CTQ90215.1 metallopeptidase [Kibdelosporangium sp. MJ126-NF4]